MLLVPEGPLFSFLVQKSNCEEALELLKMSLDSCKQFPLSLIMFYDELTEMMDCKIMHPIIMEWSVVLITRCSCFFVLLSIW